MIIVNIKGGIGNQLYQYALARRIEMNNPYPVKIDIRSYGNYIFPHKFRLNTFNTHYEIASEENVNSVIGKTVNLKNYHTLPLYKNFGIVSKALRYLYRKMDQLSYHYKSYLEEKQFTIDKRIPNVHDNTYLDGYWSKYAYFTDIRDVLIEEISLKDEYKTPKYRAVKDDIERKNAVSIHIRRGYAKRKVDENVFGVLPLSYYQRAVELIKKKVDNPFFYIFSDDSEWAQNNLHLEGNSEFINFGAEGDYLELLLMSKCKHNIIANSTFSWWAAWLNQYSDKLVIAPQTWYRARKYQRFYELGYKIPREWVRIPNG